MRGRSPESMSLSLDTNLVPFFICLCDGFLSLSLSGRPAARDEGDTSERLPSSPSAVVPVHSIPLSIPQAVTRLLAFLLCRFTRDRWN